MMMVLDPGGGYVFLYLTSRSVHTNAVSCSWPDNNNEVERFLDQILKPDDSVVWYVNQYYGRYR